MKQIPYILTAAVLTLCLTGCGRSAPIAAVTTEAASETVPIVTTTPVETTQAAEIPTEFTIPETEPVKEEAVSADAVSTVNNRQESSSAGSAPSVTHTSGTSSVTQTSGTSIEETKPLSTTTPSHIHQYSKSVTKPGCTTEGFTTYTCSCGDTYPADFVPAAGHSWGSWETTKEPTVSTTGVKVRKCRNCSASQEEVIPKLEAPAQPEQSETHTHTYGLATEVQPTCTSDGCYIRKCTVCGAEEKKPSYKPAIGHSYSVISTVPADCTHNGSITYQCSVCGDTCSETTSAAHSWVHHHEDAVTHTEVYVRCHCGWSAPYNGGAGIDAYMAHQNSIPPEELNSHSYTPPRKPWWMSRQETSGNVLSAVQPNNSLPSTPQQEIAEGFFARIRVSCPDSGFRDVSGCFKTAETNI